MVKDHQHRPELVVRGKTQPSFDPNQALAIRRSRGTPVNLFEQRRRKVSH
jgi:hypothetical protein